MILLAPWALWFAVLGSAVIAFYLLRIKRRQATVPALDFWLNLAGRTKVHSLWDRLKRLLSLLLWLAILACLVLALGNPVFSAGRIKPRAIAVVIDNSASMQAVEPDSQGRTRLQLAQRALAELTSGRPVDDEWLLIEAGPEPRVLQPWTIEAGALRRAAESLPPFAGPGALAPAIELAAQLTAGKPDPCIVVISDGAAGHIAAVAQADPRIIYWPVGRTDDNLGISRLSVRADRRLGNYQVLLSVVNASDKKVQTQATLRVDGSTHGVELIAVEPHATWEKTLVIDPPAEVLARGGVLRVTLDRADALQVDNEALAILEPTRPAVVWLITAPDSAYFFEQALSAMDPLVWAEESLTMTPERYEQAATALASAAPGTSPAPIRPPDLVIFNDCAPARLPSRGRFVFIDAWPREIPASITGKLEAPQLFLDPRPHALNEHVSLQGARLASARKVVLIEPVRVLAASADGDPLIFLVDQPERQSLCLAFDVLESDLPFRNAFPLLLRNAVAYMQQDAAAWVHASYRIGERIAPLRPLPAGVSEVPVAVQRGKEVQPAKLPVEAGRFVFTDTGAPAALRLTIGDETVYAAVSLLDAGESRLQPLPAPADPAVTLGLSRRLLAALPWVGLTALVAGLIALEWLTYHLRWTE